jgi:hypothetical protein
VFNFLILIVIVGIIVVLIKQSGRMENTEYQFRRIEFQFRELHRVLQTILHALRFNSVSGHIVALESIEQRLKEIETAMEGMKPRSAQHPSPPPASASMVGKDTPLPPDEAAVTHPPLEITATLPVPLETLPTQRPALPVPPPSSEPSQTPITPVFLETKKVPLAPVPKMATANVPSRPVPPSPPPPPKRPAAPPFDWEKFTGVNLFAWLGGVALVLGAAFFVKYSLEHDLISPALRIVIGLLLGSGCIVSGLRLPREKYSATIQSLCAAGIGVLYTSIFAAHAIYKFTDSITTFIFMALVTVTAFLLAIRLDSKFVALLGMAGGFLTPPLLSTGENHPFGLFSYVTLLDLGLVAVALKRRWVFLLWCALTGTALLQAGWTAKFFEADAIWTGLAIYLFFPLVFLATLYLADRQNHLEAGFSWPAALMPFLSIGFAFYLLSFPKGSIHPLLIFGFLALLDMMLAVVAFKRGWTELVGCAAFATFAMQALWTQLFFEASALWIGMAIYLFFPLFFLGILWWSIRKGQDRMGISLPAALLPFVSMGFIAYLLTFPKGSFDATLLFALLAILNILLIVLAFNRGWSLLAGSAAIGTLLLEWEWVANHFEPGFLWVGMAIFLFFVFLFMGVLLAASSKGLDNLDISLPAALLPLASVAFAAYLLRYPPEVIHPGWPLAFLFVLSSAVTGLTLKWPNFCWAHRLVGTSIFLLLTYWTTQALTPGLLYWGLGSYLVFAILYTAFPLLWQRQFPAARHSSWDALFPALMLVPILFAIGRNLTHSYFAWLFVFLLDLLVIVLAAALAALWGLLAALVLTVGIALAWLLHLPQANEVTGLMGIVALFSLLFFGAGLMAQHWLSRKKRDDLTAAGSGANAETFDEAAWLPHLPAISAMLPFILMMTATIQLPLFQPAPVFGMALLLTVLLMGLICYQFSEALAPVAMGSVALLLYVWHSLHFSPAQPWTPLPWYVLFFFLFLAFPFATRRFQGRHLLPWGTAAFSGPVYFYLIYQLYLALAGPQFAGLVPALLALIYLAALSWLVWRIPANHPARQTLLALFGGVTLFFVSFIFPIQFEKEWLTVGWALEGAALVWLYHRIPHPGLKSWGGGLLAISFIRLTLNPAVFDYHSRSGFPILNWYFYTYALVAVCCLVAAGLWRPRDQKLWEWPISGWLNLPGGILLFLLLNIEIADFFSTGQAVTFSFSASFAQDLTYSLGWASYAFLLLIIGVWKGSRAARFGGLGLLLVAATKVFIFDMWRLGQLYRVASLVGLALFLFLVTFLYQRYLSNGPEKRS